MAKPLGPSTLTFAQRYAEMHALGLQDWEIAKRMNITTQSLERMMDRAKIPTSDLLREINSDKRSHRKAQKARHTS